MALQKAMYQRANWYSFYSFHIDFFSPLIFFSPALSCLFILRLLWILLLSSSVVDYMQEKIVSEGDRIPKNFCSSVLLYFNFRRVELVESILIGLCQKSFFFRDWEVSMKMRHSGSSSWEHWISALQRERESPTLKKKFRNDKIYSWKLISFYT